MSLCDKCRLQGRCCIGVALGGGEWMKGSTTLEVIAALVQHDPLGRLALPFLPLWRSKGVWMFWCPLLGRDGRCTSYGYRPTVCIEYPPGLDELCAEHVP